MFKNRQVDILEPCYLCWLLQSKILVGANSMRLIKMKLLSKISSIAITINGK